MTDRPRLTPAIADVRRAVRESWDASGVVAGDLVLVACSGGPDSLALAAAVAFEAPRAGISAGAVIVEHGIQAITKDVAARTAEVLRTLGLDPVQVAHVSVGEAGGPEAAARVARYEALDEAAAALDAKVVMLGHTLDDQAETVMLGLARGSGPRAINGMAVHAGRYLRPLLGIKRETTHAFCEDSGLDPWIDPQNSEDRFTRVRVRQTVLPMLEIELGHGIAESLARTAELVREDSEYLDELALAAYDGCVSAGPTSLELSVAALETLAAPIRNRVILRALEVFGPTFSRVHVLAVADLVTNWHGQKELTLPGVRVVRTGSKITLKTTKTLKSGAC
ncbi:MAG: tRNA lysidine(34) synthetase TilS [Rhodoluna sp.]|nr:tRNA lysidine(34) synthetase TilS [Rhodoluna sp.]